MVKNTVSGSVLAKMFPTLFKHFSENASQEEFNKAEQEAAVAFQNHNSNGVTTETTQLGADVSALFPTSAKTLEGKLSAEEIKLFAADAAEISKRLGAQAQGNQAVADDLKNTKATLTETEGKLTAALNLNTELKPKADQWDAYKASLNNSNSGGDSTNGKTKAETETQLTAKDQKHLDTLTSLSAKYPGLMAGIGVPAKEA